MATKNLKLDEVELSNTFGQWLESFNGNMGKIDALPIPIEYGKNTTMEYLKLSNGKVIMWGRLNHGTKYPCTSSWTRGYLSDKVTIDFPIALANSNPAVFAMAEATAWKDVAVCPTSVTYTTFSFKYWHASNDAEANNSKTCNILVIGDWK